LPAITIREKVSSLFNATARYVFEQRNNIRNTNKHEDDDDDDDSYKYYEDEPYRIQYELSNKTTGGKLIGTGWSLLRSLFVTADVDRADERRSAPM
jgi:hypothetical protein